MNLIEIKTKIKNLDNILQVFNAMKLMSSSKYQTLVKKLKKIKEAQQFLFTYPEEEIDKQKIDPIYIICGSDKGLCGNFNTRMRTALKEIPNQSKVIIFGKKLIPLAKERNWNLINAIIDVDHYDLYALSYSLSSQLKILPLSSLYLAYMKYYNAGNQQPTIENILNKEDILYPNNFLQEGNPADISKNLYITAKLYRMLIETKTCEHLARMQAMENSINNSKDMKEKYQLIYNKERQSKITQEILEIVNGSMVK